MNNKFFIFLLILIGFNTLRYGSYLLEGSRSMYYLVFFGVNITALIWGIASIIKTRSNGSKEG